MHAFVKSFIVMLSTSTIVGKDGFRCQQPFLKQLETHVSLARPEYTLKLNLTLLNQPKPDSNYHWKLWIKK